MKKIVILRGLPSSGKTTWAKQQITKNPNFARVSRDDIRKDFLGGWSQKKEKIARQVRDILVRSFIAQGKSVIIDDTNLAPSTLRQVTHLGEELGAKVVINDSFLKIPPETCIDRDLKRGDKAVGAKVIWNMYEKYIAPSSVKKLDNEFEKQGI